MKPSRFISPVLMLALILTQFAACGGSESTDDTSTPDPVIREDTTAPAEEPEYIAPVVDYEGKTFTLGTLHLDLSYAIADYQIISHDEETGDVINDAIIRMTRQVEEELNVNLELIDIGGVAERNSAERITTPIYADEDVMQAALPLTAALPGLLSVPSLLYDLNDIPTLNLSHSWWDPNSVEEYNIGGKQYTVIGDLCLYHKGAPVVTFFNKQLVESLSLENPYQIVYDGKWTLDKMIELATAAASDLNGDQKVDKDDRFGIISEASGLSYLLIGAGVDYSRRSGDEIEMALYSEKAASIVEKMIPFLRTKDIAMVDADWSSGYNEVFGELFTPTFMENRALFFSNQLLLALDFRAMQADFGVLPMPKYDEEQEGYHIATNDWWCDNLIVPATNRDLEMTGHVLEAMGYYSQQYVTKGFIDTTVLGKSVRDEDSAKMVELILDSQYYDIACLFDWGGIAPKLRTMFNDKDTNLASNYAAIESQIEAAMEKTMDELLGG